MRLAPALCTSWLPKPHSTPSEWAPTRSVVSIILVAITDHHRTGRCHLVVSGIRCASKRSCGRAGRQTRPVNTVEVAGEIEVIDDLFRQTPVACWCTEALW